MHLCKMYLIDDRSNAHIIEGDLFTTIEALQKVATQSQRPPEGIVSLIEMIKMSSERLEQSLAMSGPTAQLHSGIGKKFFKKLLFYADSSFNDEFCYPCHTYYGDFCGNRIPLKLFLKNGHIRDFLFIFFLISQLKPKNMKIRQDCWKKLNSSYENG